MDEKKDGVALPAQLYVSEAAKSAEKTKQERLAPDPDDATFAKLIEDSTKDSNDNS